MELCNTISCLHCNLKSVHDIFNKLHVNINQSTLDVKQNARTITLAFILLELFPFELCHKIVSALLIENHSRYLFETSFEYQSTAYHAQSARMELCKYSMIIYFFLNDECAIVNSIARLSLLDMNWIVCT